MANQKPLANDVGFVLEWYGDQCVKDIINPFIFTNEDGQEIARIEHSDGLPTKIILTEEHCEDLVIEGTRTLDVEAIPYGEGYKIKKRVTRWIPQEVEIEEEFEQGQEKLTYEGLLTWAKNLKNVDLEAALQVYQDRWNFTSGDIRDQTIYQLLLDERENRCG